MCWALSRADFAVASPGMWSSSIHRMPGVSSSNRNRAESSPPGGMSEARTARACHSVETLSSVRRTYGCPADSPSIQMRTLAPAEDARKNAWIMRLDWTFGTKVSLTTEAGAMAAVSLRLPCPECGFSRSIAIVLAAAWFPSTRQPHGTGGYRPRGVAGAPADPWATGWIRCDVSGCD